MRFKPLHKLAISGIILAFGMAFQHPEIGTLWHQNKADTGVAPILLVSIFNCPAEGSPNKILCGHFGQFVTSFSTPSIHFCYAGISPPLYALLDLSTTSK